jgi:cell filamentation protein, protein adenylyltransferase
MRGGALELGVFELDAQGRRCFRPDAPACPAFDDIIDRLEPATAALRKLDRALTAWPQPERVVRLFAALDAVHSCGADGSAVTFTELMVYRTSLRTAPNPEDAAGVAACADISEPLRIDPVSAALRIHRRLAMSSPTMSAHDPTAPPDGLKRRSNGILDRDATNSLLYYTRPASVAAALEDWRTFSLGFDLDTPEIVRQILSHWMFEHIQPFADGNSRIGRLLVPLMLRSKGATNLPCAFLGEAVHRGLAVYVDALRAARLSGDMTAWTRLMLMFLERTATANLVRLERLAGLAQAWRRIAANSRPGSMVHKLIPFALTRPAFTRRDALEALGGTAAALSTAALRLIEAGVLTTPDAAAPDPLFEAPAVLDIFDRFRE